MCLFHLSFYIEMMMQLYSVERSTKERLKNEQGWL